MKRIIAKLIVVISIVNSVLIAQSNLTKTDKPYGGGSGYYPIIETEECDFVINDDDFNNFKKIVENAQYGDRIYISDDLSIEIPAEGSITIPDGVTLASGRGRDGSAGALIHLDEIREYVDWQWYYYIIAGNDVRITGLRIRGPDGSNSYENAGYCPGGILQDDGQNLEIENCEIYNWYWIAIHLRGSMKANIHHNYIHNNQKPGAGYGVGNGWKSSSVIRYNIFNYNRHSISANGDAVNGNLPSYKAEYNLVLPCGNGYRFDVHGYYDEYKNNPQMLANCNYWDSCNKAGELIEINYNTFITIENGQYMIMFRGIPNVGGVITNNIFNRRDRAINQKLYYYVRDTCKTCAPCTKPVNAILNMDGQPYPWNETWCYYWGDFNIPSNHMFVISNDYNTDINLRQIDWGGNDEGYVVVAPEIRFTDSDKFAYGDFNSDGRTDIINKGYISYSGLSEWYMYSDKYTIDPNHTIDFNGDDKEDSIRIVHPTKLWPDGCY